MEAGILQDVEENEVGGGSCEVINIGMAVGRALEKLNEDILRMGKTSMVIEPGVLNENISYSQGLLIGLNSMVGTGNCLLVRNATITSYDLHVGFTLLSVFLPDIKILEKHISAFFRIRANSFNIRFSILNKGRCTVNLEQMKMVVAALVQNGAALEEFDQLQLDHFFQQDVVPKMNEILKGYQPAVEKLLQKNCDALRRFDKNIDLSKLLN